VNDTFRLGRVAGIPIGINWTWLLVFVFFTWSLASTAFPASNPGLSTATYIGIGVAAVLLFFASLLVHELGHALRARREGVEIEGITLWLFGGVARLGGPFPSAGAELRIGVAGPLVTLVLGALFVGLALVTHFAPAVDGVLAWLGYINLVLVAFNLLPAMPLDGGRVFHAALWRLRGDFAWATRVAVRVAGVFAVGMVAAGVLVAFATGSFSGLWLAVLGWFLLGGARAEGQLASRPMAWTPRRRGPGSRRAPADRRSLSSARSEARRPPGRPDL
jgi:Zn-dependent protease